MDSKKSPTGRSTQVVTQDYRRTASLTNMMIRPMVAPPPPPPPPAGPFVVEPANAFTVTNSGAGNGVYPTLQIAFNNVANGGTVIVKSNSLFNVQAGYCNANNVTMQTDTTGVKSIFRNKTTGDSFSPNSKKGIVVLGNFSSVTNSYSGGNGWTFIDIGFENAGWDNVSDVNYGPNLAGIRMQGGSLTCLRCSFVGCQNGVLGGTPTRTDNSQPSIFNFTNCLVDGCGVWTDGSGNEHGLYITAYTGSQLNLTGCTFQYTFIGHLVKSRTNFTTVNNCTFNKSSNSFAWLTGGIGVYPGEPIGASRAIDQCNAGQLSVTNCTFYEDGSSQADEMIGMGGDFGGQTPYVVNSFTGTGNKVYSTKASPVYVNYINQAFIVANGGQPYNQATGGVASPAGCDKWPGTTGWVNEPVITTAPAPRFATAQLPVTVSSWSQVTQTGQWYQFSNSNMDQLDAQVVANDPSFNNAIWESGRGFSSQISFAGASFDYTLEEMYFCAGGGDGCMYNGWYKLTTAGSAPVWSILKYPSQLRTTDWNTSATLFANTGRFPVGRGTNSPYITTKGYYPAPAPQTGGASGTTDQTTWVPDCWAWPIVTGAPGTTNNDPTTMQPCASQYYGGQVVVPGLGSGGAAAIIDVGVTGPVKYDIHAATPKWSQMDPAFEPIGPVDPASGHRIPRKADCYTWWDATLGKIFFMGDLYNDFYNIVAYDPVTNTRFQASSGAVPSPQYYYLLWFRTIGSPMFDQRKFYFHQRSVGYHFVLDFSTATSLNNYLPTATPIYPVDQFLFANQSSAGVLDRIQLACYVPVLGPSGSIVAVCYSGRTIAIDTVTGNVTELVAASGNSIVTDVQDGYIGNGEWGRMRYIPSRKCIILVSATYNNIKVLKVA